MRKWITVRDQEIIDRVADGMTYSEAARCFELSRQRVHQICATYGLVPEVRAAKAAAQPLFDAERRIKEAYWTHKSSAKKRGIVWELTFCQWWKLWVDSGHWPERGVGRGKYVMARTADVGPYALGNVRIDTFESNLMEQGAVRRQAKAASRSMDCANA